MTSIKFANSPCRVRLRPPELPSSQWLSSSTHRQHVQSISALVEECRRKNREMHSTPSPFQINCNQIRMHHCFWIVFSGESSQIVSRVAASATRNKFSKCNGVSNAIQILSTVSIHPLNQPLCWGALAGLGGVEGRGVGGVTAPLFYVLSVDGVPVPVDGVPPTLQGGAPDAMPRRLTTHYVYWVVQLPSRPQLGQGHRWGATVDIVQRAVVELEGGIMTAAAAG